MPDVGWNDGDVWCDEFAAARHPEWHAHLQEPAFHWVLGEQMVRGGDASAARRNLRAALRHGEARIVAIESRKNLFAERSTRGDCPRVAEQAEREDRVRLCLISGVRARSCRGGGRSPY